MACRVNLKLFLSQNCHDYILEIKLLFKYISFHLDLACNNLIPSPIHRVMCDGQPDISSSDSEMLSDLEEMPEHANNDYFNL